MPPEMEVFTLFPKLPIELRLKIWEEACYNERDVHVVVILLFEDLHNEYKPVFGYRSSSILTAVLHTSSESRQEALKYYQLSLGTEFEIVTRGIRASTKIEPTVYINPDSDRLWLRGTNLSYEATIHFFASGVRRVALDAEGYSIPFECYLWLHEPLEEILLYRSRFEPEFKDPRVQLLV